MSEPFDIDGAAIARDLGEVINQRDEAREAYEAASAAAEQWRTWAWRQLGQPGEREADHEMREKLAKLVGTFNPAAWAVSQLADTDAALTSTHDGSPRVWDVEGLEPPIGTKGTNRIGGWEHQEDGWHCSKPTCVDCPGGWREVLTHGPLTEVPASTEDGGQ